MPRGRKKKGEEQSTPAPSRHLLNVVHVPGVGYPGGKPLTNVKPNGTWPHTDEEVQEWVKAVVQEGLSRSSIYMPEAVRYIASHTFWPAYPTGSKGRCPHNIRVVGIINAVVSDEARHYQAGEELPDEEGEATPTPPVVLCPCGKPLHYSDPEKQASVEKSIAEKGETVFVKYGGVEYAIHRHYLALHGSVKGSQLASLAEQGVVKVVSRQNA